MGETLLVSVHDDVDVALPPARHGFRAVAASLLESEAAQGLLEPGGTALIDSKLHELDARADCFRRKPGMAGQSRSCSPTQFVEHHDEGALPVDGNAARG